MKQPEVNTQCQLFEPEDSLSFFCFPMAQSCTCLIGAEKNYTFPVNPVTPEYFQWLRKISDDELRDHMKQATPEQLTRFIEKRQQHIIDHIEGKTDAHTVCMPPDFTEIVHQDDKRHWQVDYDYFHRLLGVFAGHPFTKTDMEERFAVAVSQ
jgi:hypothetical protein